MAESKSKKTTKPTKKDSKKPANKTSKVNISKKLKELHSVKNWLTLSLILNFVLIVGLLLSVSNPTSYTDASSGYSIDIASGWVRQDQFEVFRITKGGVDDPKAQIYAYGQRGATLGFYDSPQEDRDATLDLVTQQINEGQNQFVLTRFELSNFTYTAERGQREDGTEFIRSHFTATDSEGQPVEGEHMLLITMGGGVYSVVAWADVEYWPQVADTIDQTISTFTAP